MPRTAVPQSLLRLATSLIVAGLLLAPVPAPVTPTASAAPAATGGPLTIVGVFPVGPPTATEGLRVQWVTEDHNYINMWIERQSPPKTWAVYQYAGFSDDTGLQRDRDYSYRLCGTTFDGQNCSDYRSGRIPSPSTQPPAGGSKPPTNGGGSPPPPDPPTPTLTATAASGVQINLQWNDPGYSFQPDSAALYRDGKVIFPMAKGAFTTQHADANLRPNSGPYTYKVCMTWPRVGEKCSADVKASPKPVAPTAPASLKVASLTLPGGKGANGILLQPRHKVSLTWTNTSIPGVYMVVEREDRQGKTNRDPNSPIQVTSQAVWTEAARLTAKDPTSADVDADAGVIAGGTTLSVGKTFRVCSVVPSLGAAGKVCSASATLQ